MATSPPILIYTPGGGVPVGPISGGGPVYSQAGTTPLIEDQAYVDVVFGSIQTDDTWVLATCDVENTTDFEPLNIWPGIITDRTPAGFRLQLNGMPDSGNYYLHWAVSGVNITPGPASTYYLTGPASGAFGSATTFTVALPPSTTITGTMTITLDDGGDGGTFAPTSVTLTTTSRSVTFTYTAASYGAKTISVANNVGIIDPAPLTFTSLAPTYTLTGPSTGDYGTASTPFTVALSGAVVGTVNVTPSSGGGGGTFTPTSVALTTGAPSNTFTYTPASAGTKTISATNDAGLTNPANLSYVATAPPFSPAIVAGLKLWLKADSLVLSDGDPVSTWSDSSGVGNDATQSGTARPVYKTSIVNGKPVVRFDGVDDLMLLTGTITIAGSADFCLFIVHQTSGDGCLAGTKNAASANQMLRIGESAANKLSYNSDADGSTLSNVLTIPRTSWNLAFSRRESGSIIEFSDSTGYVGGAGGRPGTTNFGAVGALASFGNVLFTTGDIAEVLFYDNALAVGDLTDVRNYLNTRYGIA